MQDLAATESQIHYQYRVVNISSRTTKKLLRRTLQTYVPAYESIIKIIAGLCLEQLIILTCFWRFYFKRFWRAEKKFFQSHVTKTKPSRSLLYSDVVCIVLRRSGLQVKIAENFSKTYIQNWNEPKMFFRAYNEVV